MKLSLSVVAVALLLAFTSAVAAPCFKYGRPVEITGTLEAHTYPGPPNFASIKAGDKPLNYFRLALFAPACATALPSSVEYVSVSDVLYVQLVLMQPGYNQLRPFLGKVVTLKGTLFSPIDAFHQKFLLLNNVSLVKRQR